MSVYRSFRVYPASKPAPSAAAKRNWAAADPTGRCRARFARGYTDDRKGTFTYHPVGRRSILSNAGGPSETEGPILWQSHFLS